MPFNLHDKRWQDLDARSFESDSSEEEEETPMESLLPGRIGIIIGYVLDECALAPGVQDELHSVKQCMEQTICSALV